MPPILSAAQRRARARARDDRPPRGRAAAARRQSAKKYKKVRHYKTKGNSGRKSNALIPIRTLLPKEVTVGIQFRQVIQFASMGYSTVSGGQFSPTLIKVNLLDPCAKIGADSNGIVTVLGYGSPAVNPVYSLLNPQTNLATELLEYGENKYDKACVISSSASVRVQGTANQTLGKYLANVPGQGHQGEGNGYGSNYPPHLNVQSANKDGELYIWSVRQRSTGNLMDNGQGLNIHEVRTTLPGAKMRKHNCYQNGTTSKAVTMTSSYTPKFLGIKDWRDNLNKIAIQPDGADRNGQAKDCFMYLGIGNRFGNTQNQQPATVSIEISCNYNVRFLQRTNDPKGGDEPLAVPHSGEL